MTENQKKQIEHFILKKSLEDKYRYSSSSYILKLILEKMEKDNNKND